MNRFLISGVSALALMAGAAGAQEILAEDEGSDITTLELISVTANRTPTEKSKVGSMVEQVTQQEIEERSLTSVSDYLTLLPGVSFTSSGGIGTQSNLYIRGIGGGYVKTLYNGIDVSDTAGTPIITQYQYLQAGGVTGIEVLKGSQSTLYGSNAIAGLVDITTLGEITEGVEHTVEVEGGSFGTVRGRYGFAGAAGDSRIAANISGIRTDGISSLAGGSERDGYRNTTFDLAAEHRINDAFSIFGSLLYIDAKTEFDAEGWDDINFVSVPLPDDAESQERAKMMGGRFGFDLDLMDGRLKNRFSMQGFKSDRDSYHLSFGSSSYVGSRLKYDYQGAFEATDRILLQYGADHERQSVEVSESGSFVDATHELTGLWAQLAVEPVDNLTLTAGLRHDQHSEFGGHMTYRGTASYLFEASGTRLHSSFGTGFRAPSLYELFHPTYGRATLDPETSRSFDIGVEQTLLDGRLIMGIGYFNVEIEDRIAFDGPRYSQVDGRTRSQGIEASFSYAATDWLQLGGSYTYTEAKNPDGSQALRVPKHMAVLSATARPAEKWLVSADLKYAAGAVDSNFFAPFPYPGVHLDDYVLLNAKVTYQINDSTEIYLRGENLLDQDYEVVHGYNTPGLSVFGGFKAKF